MTEILSNVFLIKSKFYDLSIIVSNEVEREYPDKQDRKSFATLSNQLCVRMTPSFKGKG